MVEAQRQQLSHHDMLWNRIPEQAWCACGHQKAVHQRNILGRTCGSCVCHFFHERDCVMPLPLFADRIAADTRRRLALAWAWKASGLDGDRQRTFDGWMLDSRRVWRAWREAGSPFEGFGKQLSFGDAKIPALED